MTLKLVMPLLILCLSIYSCSESESKQDETFPIAHIETRLGSMFFWLHDETPNHKSKFIELAHAKHYDSFTMNRVVKNFVIQGGCPDSVQYFENSPYLLEPEFNDSLGHIYGALGIGRDNNPDKLSNVCQFYIVNKETGLANLDGNYMIIGQIIKGKDVLEKIEAENTNNNDMPLEDIPLKVSILEVTELNLKSNYQFDIKK